MARAYSVDRRRMSLLSISGVGLADVEPARRQVDIADLEAYQFGLALTSEGQDCEDVA